MDLRDRVAPEGVAVPIGTAAVPGVLSVPALAEGLVVLPQGVDDNPTRSRAIAAALNEAGLATLRFDLLTPAEVARRDNRFPTALLAGRLVQAVRWLATYPDLGHMAVGLFGASSGSVAVWAAGELGLEVSAVACWSSRPDVAAAQLRQVTAPTLLIVGSGDPEGLEQNLAAQGLLCCPTYLRIVPQATTLFVEPATVAEVQVTAARWFTRHTNGVDVPSSADELAEA